MKNKIISLVLVFLTVLLVFTSCSKKEVKELADFNITTVNFVQYDFVKNIVKDKADVQMILPPWGDLHLFSPSISDIKSIQDSDLFIYNDMLSDKWADDIIASLDTTKTTVLPLAKYSYLMEDLSHKNTNLTYKDDNHDMYDEHIWLSLKNARLMVNAIADAVCKIDSKNEKFYRENALKYTKEIENLHALYTDMVENSGKKTVVIADLFPFKYMFNDYNLSYKSVFTSCSHERDANPSDIASIIDVVKKEDIKVVFYTDLSDSEIADTICKQTNCKKALLHSLQKITKEEMQNGASYLSIMEQNLSNLREALN